MSDESLHFDSLSLIRIPVMIENKRYYLQEADGEAGSAYRDAKMAGMKSELDDDGNSKSVSFAGVNKAELILLSCCLYEENGTDTGIRVSRDVIKSWPDRVTQKLVEKVKEISELSGTKNPTQRNGQNDTTMS